jgi:hypothetical protein
LGLFIPKPLLAVVKPFISTELNIPFIFVSKIPETSVDVELFIIVVVETFPFTVLVISLAIDPMLFVVFEAIAATVFVDKLVASRFVATKLVIVAFVADKLSVFVVLAFIV